MFSGDENLERELEETIETNKDFKFLDEVSIFCNNAYASEELFDFYLDTYSEIKNRGMDEFSSRYFALRKAYDYVYYEDSLIEDMTRLKLKEELERTRKGHQNIETMINKYVEIGFCEKEKKEKSFFLNNLYFEAYCSCKNKNFANKWMLDYIKFEMKKKEEEKEKKLYEKDSWEDYDEDEE